MHVLDIAVEVARREVFCRLKCTVKNCGGSCWQSARVYLESLSLQNQVEYNAYLRARSTLDALSA
jgi:hypothetical protein